ncbi:hypothetical protein ACJMK2_001578, partial [Sinanodonta woodiana]
MRQRSRQSAPKHGSQQKLEQFHNTMQQLGTSEIISATPSQKLKSVNKSRLYTTPEFEHLTLEAAKLDPLSPIFFNLHNTTIQADELDSTLAIAASNTTSCTPTPNFKVQNSNTIGHMNITLADVVENTKNRNAGITSNDNRTMHTKQNSAKDRNSADVVENTPNRTFELGNNWTLQINIIRSHNSAD